MTDGQSETLDSVIAAGNDRAAEIARGRELVESGETVVSMLDNLALVAYLQQQREIVRRHGCCGKHETWVSPMGEVRCKHTRDPCPREKLAEIIAQWAIINRRENDTARTSRFARRRHRAGRKP